MNLSVQVFLGLVSFSQAIQLNQMDGGFPDFWQDQIADPMYSNTWRFTGVNGHKIMLVNETDYLQDAPDDYYFPDQNQWEPDAGIALQSQSEMMLGEPIGLALKHHKVLSYQHRQNMAQITPTTVQLYKPYPVQSRLVPQSEINDAWSNKQYDKSNEVAYGADGPADYTVEAYTDAELKNTNPLAALVQKKSGIEPTTVELYKPYPVQSHFVPRDEIDDAWSQKQFDKSNELAYGADGPADYLVEPAVIPESLFQRSRSGRIGYPFLSQQRSFIEPTTVELYKPYPVQSRFVPRDEIDDAWSTKQFDKSNELAYGADGPADYLVEPAVIPDSLVQRSRNGIYKVKDSHSYISPYTHSDHAWSHDQHDASDEVKWVENTKTLHADYVDQLHPSAEHHLKDGRTGVPSLYQIFHIPQTPRLSQIYQVTDSHSYISPYDQRDHSFNDDQYDMSDEVKWLDTTKTLHSDYLENLLPTAEYHLQGGRTGEPEEDTD